GEQLRLLKMRVQFHLVDGRGDVRVAQEQLQLGNSHIGRADMTYEAHFDHPLHLPPGIHELVMEVRPGVRAPRANIRARRVYVRERPVHQVHVQIAHLQVGYRPPAGRDDVVRAMFVVPKLRRDPQIFTRELMKNFAYANFVTIHGGTVKMSVAGFIRASQGQSDLIGPDVVRTEGAQPYGRHESAARKLALRD